MQALISSRDIILEDLHNIKIIETDQKNATRVAFFSVKLHF